MHDAHSERLLLLLALLARAEMNRVPVVGVVLHPVTGDLYTAIRGEGAFLNGAKIEVRAAEGLGDALVVNNIGAARDDAFISTTLARLGELLRRKVQAIRMSGELEGGAVGGGREKSAESCGGLGWQCWG